MCIIPDNQIPGANEPNRVIIITNKDHATQPRAIRSTHNRIHRHRHYAKRDTSSRDRMLTASAFSYRESFPPHWH